MVRGKTIKLFFMDGDASGRVKCSIANWTGVAYKIPRTMLDDCQDMKALKQSGVYFLFGTDGDDQPVVYVGQAGSRKNGEGLWLRIKEKHASIDYWTEAVAFTTANNTLGPTEISYLENRFCKMAQEAGRYQVKNGNEPNPGNLTEETECEMEDFIDYAKMMMGALGHRALEPLISMTNIEQKEPVLEMTYNNAHAKGKRTSEGFVVLKGSVLNQNPTKACPKSALKNREKYHDKIDGKGSILEDLFFFSPSGAAEFIGGAALNGRIKWHDENGRTLKEIEGEV